MLPTADRSPSGYRLYPPDLVERPRFIDEDIASLGRLRAALDRLLDTHPATACPDEDAGTWWCRNDFARRR